MSKLDLDFMAFRLSELHRLRNMDPDDIVFLLDVSTGELLKHLSPLVDNYIEEQYDNGNLDDSDGEEC